MEKVIEIKNLTKEYKKTLKAVNDLSFDVYQGEILGLLGPNGSGKSTTINCILSLLNYQSGTISIFDQVMKPDAYAIKKDIISNLRKKEYEVYIIESFRDAKNLLRKNPDSVLFINIDAQLSIGAWFNFLRSFYKEESLKTIQATVIS